MSFLTVLPAFGRTAFVQDGGVTASSGWFNWPGAGFLNFPPPEVTDRLLDRPDSADA